MKHSDQLDQLASALTEAQAEFTAIPKTDTNPFFKSKYASLPAVVETASPVLATHGLSVAQFIGLDDQGDTLTTWLLHKSGQFIAQTMRLHLNKQDAQGQGSAVTYARRYSYMAVLGLVADEDDDGNAASKPKPTTPTLSPDEPDKAQLQVLRQTYVAKKLLGPLVTKFNMEHIGKPVPKTVADVEKLLAALKDEQA